MQQITLVFWKLLISDFLQAISFLRHTNIFSLQIFPLQRIEKTHKFQQTYIYIYIKQLQVRPVQHSHHGLERLLGILSRHHCKTPMKLRMAKTMKRHPEIGVQISTFLLHPTRDPQNEGSLSKSFDDCIGGRNLYPKTFP